MVLITPEQLYFFITFKRRITCRAHMLYLNTDKQVLSQGYDPVIVGTADPLTSI